MRKDLDDDDAAAKAPRGKKAEGAQTGAEEVADDAGKGGASPRVRHADDAPISEERREALRDEAHLPDHAPDIQENAVAPTAAAKLATGLGSDNEREPGLGNDVFVQTWGPAGLEKTEAGKVVKLWGAGVVNVSIFKENGGLGLATSVNMRKAGEDRRAGFSWSWSE